MSAIASHQNSIIKSLHLVIPADNLDPFVEWQGKLNSAIATFPGFVSLEIAYPSIAQNQWAVIERFDSQENSDNWNNSEIRKSLINEIKGLTADKTIKEEFVGLSSFQDGITEVLVTEVDPSREKEFKVWAAKIHQVEAKFPGFRGVYLQSPSTKNGRHWITILKFDSSENLDRWLNSPERHRVLDESNNLLSSFESHRVVSPYAGWFASTAKNGALPPAWKQALIVLLVLYPIIMFEIKFFNPLVKDFHNSFGVFLGNALSVALLTWPMMPLAIKALNWFLVPPEGKYTSYTILGVLLIMGLYLLELLFFWDFVPPFPN